MGWFVSDERIPVVLECRCPGTPHDEDTVWLRAELPPEAGFAVLKMLREYSTNPEKVEEQTGRIYAQYGVIDWTFVDEAGEPVPFSRELVGKLSWDVVFPIAQKGDAIYAEGLTRPLVARALASSRNGHTAKSTSPKRASSRSRQKP